MRRIKTSFAHMLSPSSPAWCTCHSHPRPVCLHRWHDDAKTVTHSVLSSGWWGDMVATLHTTSWWGGGGQTGSYKSTPNGNKHFAPYLKIPETTMHKIAADVTVWIPIKLSMQQGILCVHSLDNILSICFFHNSTSLSLFMCEMCSLIVTYRHFPSGTHGPLHSTMTHQWKEFSTIAWFTANLSVPLSSAPCPCGALHGALHTRRVSNMPICLGVN